MLDSLPIILIVSTALGFLAGLGVGGGSLLILWVTLVLEMAYPQARVLNLSFFIPCAIIASLFRWRQGKLSIKKILPAVLAGSIGACLFSILGNRLDISILKKLFGGLLLLTGLRELCYRPRKAR
jgi:uncharacterized membrane protein YfcA